MTEAPLPTITFRPELIANPYPTYDQLRSADPVHWDEALGAWIVTRHADVLAVLRDRRYSARRIASYLSRLSEADQPGFGDLGTFLAMWMIFTDPPDQPRLRATVNRAFMPTMLEPRRARIEQLVASRLDAMLETQPGAQPTSHGEVDLIRELAVSLPLTIICELIGLPTDDIAVFKRWSDDIAAFVGTGRPDLERATAARQTVTEVKAYLADLLVSRRAQTAKSPDEDLLAMLEAARSRGDLRDDAELISTAALLLVTGNETTTNLIGNGILALIQNRTEQARLRADPSLIATAVEEFLRYESPIQFAPRIAKEDVELAGRSIRPADRVFAVVGAANRDPQVFTSPNRLDIGRADNKHVAFGYASHFCLGAPLARMEAQIAINAVLARLPRLELACDPADVRYQPNITLRGLAALPLAW